MNILVSACLIGVCCRYNGSGVLHESIKELMETHSLIPVCPEQLGGLPTPRPPAERRDSCVVTNVGEDVTEEFVRGAQETLKVAQLYQCSYAIFKERSPSCGCGKIYNGTFTGEVIEGNGITSQLLQDNGIKVVGETQIKKWSL